MNDCDRLERLEWKLDYIVRLLHLQHREIKIMSQEFDDLEAQVRATNTAQASALLLIQGIAARLQAAGTDPARVAALSAELRTNSDALAAAVIANTPAS